MNSWMNRLLKSTKLNFLCNLTLSFRVCVVKFMPVVWTINIEEKELSELEASQMVRERKKTNKRDRRSLMDSPCAIEKILRNKKQKTERGTFFFFFFFFFAW